MSTDLTFPALPTRAARAQMILLAGQMVKERPLDPAALLFRGLVPEVERGLVAQAKIEQMEATVRDLEATVERMRAIVEHYTEVVDRLEAERADFMAGVEPIAEHQLPRAVLESTERSERLLQRYHDA